MAAGKAGDQMSESDTSKPRDQVPGGTAESWMVRDAWIRFLNDAVFHAEVHATREALSRAGIEFSKIKTATVLDCAEKARAADVRSEGEPTDAEVEAAAKAMVVREALAQGRTPPEAEERWDMREDAREPYRLNAHAALRAARVSRALDRKTR